MRILKRVDINSEAARHRKDQIDEGVQLAEKVDTLRRTLADEEAKLSKFRLDAKDLLLKDTETYNGQIGDLKDEVERLTKLRDNMALPPDVDEERKRYKKGQEDNQIERAYLLQLSAELIQRETKVESDNKELFEREARLQTTEADTIKLNDKAVKNFEESDKVKLDTVKWKEEVEKDFNNRYVKLEVRERQLDIKEANVNLQKEQNEKDKQDIEQEKIHIASQQETLRTAWLNIKKLQN